MNNVVEAATPVGAILEASLFRPAEEFTARPSKRFRASMVALAHRVAARRSGGDPAASTAAAEELVERLHAGSLIVDDVQDGSELRRGAPTLHRLVGIPKAINAGNWLYFRALDDVARWNLPPEQELAILRACHRALEEAHRGQAMDLGTCIDKVPRAHVTAVTMASLEAKSGALMGLAFAVGAWLGGASPALAEALERFGRRFGVALQMYDDVGNLDARLPSGEDDPKRYEDLRLRRPSWVWATAAQTLDRSAYDAFLAAVRAMPPATAVEELLVESDLRPLARHRASEYLRKAFGELEAVLGDGDPVLGELAIAAEQLARAYR
jgi:geranylgeranyl pyrophosphate synthase